ncbi:tryptophan dimethylallyltransferase family protein [Bounagaea algeriensis]
MRDSGATLQEFTCAQLRGLCRSYDIPPHEPERLVTRLLGPVADRPVQQPPAWPSDVADDATPLEFSVAFDGGGRRKLRVLGETIAEAPSVTANTRAAEQFIDTIHERDGVALDKLHAVQDLFRTDQPQGAFSWWYSMIFSPGGPPKFKVYFNPAVHGAEKAPALVEEALARLGLPQAHTTVHKHALRRFGSDVIAFFAVDLDSDPQARVKLYVSHLSGTAEDAARAAEAVPGIEHERVHEFCAALGEDTAVFDGRPLVSSYSFVDGDTSAPSNYSLYVPVRDYVPDDAVARRRVIRALAPHGVDTAEIDDVISAVATRPLTDNRGLLAHVSLRMSPGDTGTTLYVSSEAYGGTR